MWFETLTGFPEIKPIQVRENLALDGNTITSKVNGRALVCGRLEIPSLAELRARISPGMLSSGRMRVREEIADVRELHADPANTGSLFQVASQFNLLEMSGPGRTPEEGIGIYGYDHTQGPACAISAGAGTIYRNYFVPVNGQTGQTADNQIDCLAGLGASLGNSGNRLWEMKNGYALASCVGLDAITEQLQTMGEDGSDQLRALLRIGIQWDTQVTLTGCSHLVSQAYCSALPVAYCSHPSGAWEGFARLVLEASYEAVFYAALLNMERNLSTRLFLTLLGGGAFGNEREWVLSAIERTLTLFRDACLDVVIVSNGASKPDIRRLVETYQ